MNTGSLLWLHCSFVAQSTSFVEGNVDGRLQPTEVEGLLNLTSGSLAPILPTADAAVLARAVDVVLLVLNAEHSRREEAQRPVERLNQVGTSVLEVVPNGLPVHEATYYKQGNSSPTRPRRDGKRPLTAISRQVKTLNWRRPLAAASKLVKKGE